VRSMGAWRPGRPAQIGKSALSAAHGPEGAVPAREARDQLDLRPDCDRCFGLCCVAPAFAASEDFAIDKDAGQPCPNLLLEFRCAIHSTLLERGFRGCAVYDCFGAGQKVAQETFGGRDWRRNPDSAKQMFAAFMIMRQLHELLWYLAGAMELEPARSLREELGAALDEISRLTHGDAGELAKVDVTTHQRDVRSLLLRAGELVRAANPAARPHRQ
jgi:hypothetical protein